MSAPRGPMASGSFGNLTASPSTPRTTASDVPQAGLHSGQTAELDEAGDCVSRDPQGIPTQVCASHPPLCPITGPVPLKHRALSREERYPK